MNSRPPTRMPLKRALVSLRDGTHGTYERVRSGVPFLSAKNIVAGRLIVSEDESYISWSDFESINRSNYLRSGDVLITIVGSIGNLAIYDFGGACAFQRSVASLRPRNGVYNRFLLYALSTPDFQSRLTIASKTSAQGGIYLEDLGEIMLEIPEFHQQQAIADYLDRETARLDSLIAAKERLLGLLAEKRQALITRAVTRGLDPNAPMRDSGIPWLGPIPAHWETKRMKFLFQLRTDQAPDDNDYELLSLYTDIGVKPRKELEARGNKATTTDHYWIVRKGDLVVNKLLAWMGSFGVSEFDGVTSPAYDVLRPLHAIRSRYYHYLFRCGIAIPEIKRRSYGIMDMRLRLYFDQLGDMRVPVPPAHDQEAIVAQIEKEYAGIEALSQRLIQTISLLKERRSALIAAAVTGQIQVE